MKTIKTLKKELGEDTRIWKDHVHGLTELVS
jgi:hypothetical protein